MHAMMAAIIFALCNLACSRRSDSEARVKNKARAKEREKNEGRLGKRTAICSFNLILLYLCFLGCVSGSTVLPM